ncbi:MULTISPECIES: phage portal protein [Asaia]|uniref:portal protein n=1 Tax=Asaia TaxID=91914 RepID=UPI002FC27E2B
MDWQSLRARYDTPQGLPARAARLLGFGRVLDGTLYDVLPHDFSEEHSGAGEYIPLSRRRPSVRTNLCRTVVDDSVSLLFGDTHWPSFRATDQGTSEALNAFARCVSLRPMMVEAATRGSVGSTAILVEAIDGQLAPTLLDTAYLTPQWDVLGRLVSVRERYIVSGRDLAASGHSIPNDMLGAKYWWQRTWTAQDCEIMQPHPVADIKAPAVDEKRSSRHGLGFVPIVWIKNLGGASGDIDGACTFERAIDTVIEADYLLSQGGRGLRYASDPTLVLKAGSDHSGAPARQGGAASALTLPPDGDAKLLEINGAAADAVLTHYRELRALVLEQLHGNRAHSDKLSAAQSGRAMEMMCLPLIWLTDRLRQSYGEGGLLCLLRMVCQFSSALADGVLINGERFKDLDPAGLCLHWPPWFDPAEPELLALAQGLVTAVDGGLIANRTACMIYAARIGVADASEEWAKIKEEIANGERVAKPADTVRKDSTTGKTLSHQVEA